MHTDRQRRSEEQLPLGGHRRAQQCGKRGSESTDAERKHNRRSSQTWHNRRHTRHSGIDHRYRSGRPRFQRQFLGRPTVSGSQTCRIFFPMSMTYEERSSYDISVRVLKYALAALIQGIASAIRHQLFEHASHCFYSIHQIIQLRKLSLGERSPAFRSASDIAETKEQVSDFSQCKTELTRTLNDC